MSCPGSHSVEEAEPGLRPHRERLYFTDPKCIGVSLRGNAGPGAGELGQPQNFGETSMAPPHVPLLQSHVPLSPFPSPCPPSPVTCSQGASLGTIRMGLLGTLAQSSLAPRPAAQDRLGRGERWDEGPRGTAGAAGVQGSDGMWPWCPGPPQQLQGPRGWMDRCRGRGRGLSFQKTQPLRYVLRKGTGPAEVALILPPSPTESLLVPAELALGVLPGGPVPGFGKCQTGSKYRVQEAGGRH